VKQSKKINRRLASRVKDFENAGAHQRGYRKPGSRNARKTK
jgi:hypothetical protein